MEALKRNTRLLCRLTTLCLVLLSAGPANAQKIADFTYNNSQQAASDNLITKEVQFNGYTNHWHNTYHKWFRYGNLFKLALPRINETILQNKLDMAEDLGIPGLIMEEGFMNGLLSTPYEVLEQPAPWELEGALLKGNVLLFLDPESELGKMLVSKLPDDWVWPRRLKSHQYDEPALIRADLFIMGYDDKTLYIVSSSDQDTRDVLQNMIEETGRILKQYQLHKGWFGAETLLKSVTCTKGHPLEVIGTGLNEGNSYFLGICRTGAQ